MKTVIFDFDGTIADSIPAIFEIINKVLKAYGYKSLNENEIREMKNKNIITILRNIKISYLLIPFMYLHGKLLFRKRVANLKVFPGIVDVIEDLKSKGLSVGIATSNSRESVKLFLHEHKFPEIDFIHASNSPFGKDRLINKTLKRNGIVKDEVVYVGDEIRDIKATKKVGIPIIAVTWGFNTKESLKKYDPEEISETVQELSKKIYKLIS